MKIAIIAPSFPPYSTGGIASAHYNLYRKLKELGYEVKVFTYCDNKEKNKKEVDIYRYGTNKVLLNFFAVANKLYFKFKDPGKINYQLLDVVSSMLGSMKTNFYISLFRPQVIIVPDHGVPGFFIKKIKGCKVIHISHHNPVRFLDNPLFGVHSEVDAWISVDVENRSLKKVDTVVCPSEYMKYAFKETYEFNGPVHVIPNIVDEKLIDSVEVNNIRGKIRLPDDAPLIYIPSAGSIHKGSDYVFEIIRRLSKNTKKELGFYLSGSISDKLRKQLEYLPNKVKVFTPGQLDYVNNMAIVKGCSFGISPTLVESFGMAILEANFCNVPIVAFDVGGNSDIIINGENGFLVPYMDIEDLISASEKFLDEEFRERIKSTTFSSVYRRFNSNKIANEFINIV